MRILLGSVAMADEDDPPGITSPDYVVMTAIDGKLNAGWFYHWFRSRYGENFIRSLTRGAVRERLLFRRLGAAVIQLPDWETQQQAATLLLEARHAKERLQQNFTPWMICPPRCFAEPFQAKSNQLYK
jgi:type I restriction enzyme, S subunit